MKGVGSIVAFLNCLDVVTNDKRETRINKSASGFSSFNIY